MNALKYYSTFTANTKKVQSFQQIVLQDWVKFYQGYILSPCKGINCYEGENSVILSQKNPLSYHTLIGPQTHTNHKKRYIVVSNKSNDKTHLILIKS